jgi:large conductance mechanosensitive channel
MRRLCLGAEVEMMLKEFKKFLLRGNVVDLAVAVVVGAALVGVVNAMVKDVITPLIAAVGGEPNFSGLTFTINGSHFLYGDLINAIISFLVIATIVFYLLVMPVNALIARSRHEPPPDPTTKKCPECIGEIPLQARRCMFCSSELSAAV